MGYQDFSAVVTDFRDTAELGRLADEREARDVDSAAYAAQWKCSNATFNAAQAIRLVPQLFEPDSIVLLGAVIEVLRRHNMHQEARKQFVSELSTLLLVQQEELDEKDAA